MFLTFGPPCISKLIGVPLPICMQLREMHPRMKFKSALVGQLRVTTLFYFKSSANRDVICLSNAAAHEDRNHDKNDLMASKHRVRRLQNEIGCWHCQGNNKLASYGYHVISARMINDGQMKRIPVLITNQKERREERVVYLNKNGATGKDFH